MIIINEENNRVLDGSCLTATAWSNDWQQVLGASAVFQNWMVGEITLVYPAPNNKGTFILLDQTPYLTKDKPLTAIEKFFAAHRLMNYQVMRRTCRSLRAFPSQKVPIVNAHFVLFPTNNPKNSAWLNPLAIDQVTEKQGSCSVKLINGLSIEVPINRQSLIRLSTKAVYSLVTYRQDYSTTLQSAGQPLDYVSLPATPFGDTLSHQGLLQQWLLTPGEFLNQYKLEEYSQWSQELEDDSETFF